MTRISLLVLILTSLLALFCDGGIRCHAQTAAAPAVDPAIVKLMTSPYEAERKLGVKALLKLASENWGKGTFFDAWLAHPNDLVRFAAAKVLAQDVNSGRAIKKIKTLITKEKLPTRRQELALVSFEAAYRGWDGTVDFFDGKEAQVEYSAAAMQFVREKLTELADAGTHTTEFCALGKFASLDGHALPALAKIASDESEGLYQRALALSALARMDSHDFWVGKDGSFAAEVKKLFSDAPEYLKVNALFALAYFGPLEESTIKSITSFTLEDAYSAETIQGGLYYLYNLPAKKSKAAEPRIAPVLKEYLDSSYAQKVRFHTGILLARVNVKDLATQAISMIKEAPDFAAYWSLGAILSRANELSEGEREKTVNDLITWVLTSKTCAPQLQGCALWYLNKKGGALPEGVTKEKIIAAIHASMEKVHMPSEDPSFLSIRGGLDILAYLDDPKIDDAIRKHLKHESEAVRMAAALAAGNTGRKDLVPELLKAMDDEKEFAAYGAAWALNQLGDKKALEWMARYLLNGNSCLKRSCLDALRKKTGIQIAGSVPAGPGVWRLRGRAWLKALKKK